MSDRRTFGRYLAVVLIPLWMTGCTVQGTRDEVSVSYLANKFAAAEWAATEHCAKFDRMAKLVQTLPTRSEPATLFLNTRTSTFACVER